MRAPISRRRRPHVGRCPVTVGGEPPIQEPLRLVLLGRDQSDDTLADASWGDVGVEWRDETVGDYRPTRFSMTSVSAVTVLVSAPLPCSSRRGSEVGPHFPWAHPFRFRPRDRPSCYSACY